MERKGPRREVRRCDWAGRSGPMAAYHDEEWGVPVHEDTVLFEFLLLEGAQAGLSWETILRKRENYRKAFAGFDPAKVARFTPKRIERLLLDPGIVRNRLKVESVVSNARAFLEVRKEHGTFDAWLWEFVGGRPITNRWKDQSEIPATSAEGDALSKALQKRGFRFVGPTIVYAFMQAVGMVNGHVTGCFRYASIRRMK